MRVTKSPLLLLSIFFFTSVTSNNRIKKNIGIFNVVKFQNTVCEGSNNQQGTCYTTEECENNGGEASGGCAEGYGVCCTFSINCGQRSSQNNTVFMSNNPEPGSCAATICKMDDNICQLRLDFTTFAIGDPSDGTTGKAMHLLNGNRGKTDVGVAHTTMGQCLQDSFAVTAPGHAASDILCGTNSGEHLYIDASDACNDLLFILGANPAMEPMWSITVRQYGCDYENLAPKGCDQYYFDNDDNNALDTTGTVQSFNYNNGNGRHLANQDQTICIRRDAEMQRVCFSQAGGTIINDFLISSGVSGDASAMSSGLVGKLAAATGADAACGNYGTTGKGIDFDFVNVPGAQANIAGALLPIAGNDNFCGAALVGKGGVALATPAKQVGPAKAATTMVNGVAVDIPDVGQATICTSRRPFRIRFVSDAGEVDAKETVQSGFSLGYEQQ